jgi:deoxyribodipyrimidine photo-lyase
VILKSTNGKRAIKFKYGTSDAKPNATKPHMNINIDFEQGRAAALNRLNAFVPYAGRDYAAGRNTDYGPGKQSHVSQLSPYLRYRIITEREAVAAVLAKHNMTAAEKYVQEVLWRTYWKGWLEMRPDVWHNFCRQRDYDQQHFPNARAITAAENGMTGIDGFDDWAHELVQTGYLHNHARMWFASIWIFTLRLPWTLGADFFLRHLIDADSASNTLSWRWVAGLQTAGKTYLATADNIARYTNGRYAPQGLAAEAKALTEAPIGNPTQIDEVLPYSRDVPSLLLVTHEDMNPESFISGSIKAACVAAPADLLWGEKSADFVQAAAADTAQRAEAHYKCETVHIADLDAATLIQAAEQAGVKQIITAYAPVGPVADALTNVAAVLEESGVGFALARRSWDSRFWPQAAKGFFPFKAKITQGLTAEGLRFKP